MTFSRSRGGARAALALLWLMPIAADLAASAREDREPSRRSAELPAEPAYFERRARAQEMRFGETTSVFVVEVPVNVVSRGAAVHGLTVDNFEVLDGQTAREIIDFSVVDLGRLETTERAPAPVPLPARRRFLLFFDLSFTDRQSLRRSVAGGRDLLDRGLHPSDLVAVGIYGLSTGAQMLLNFSPDHAEAVEVLDALQEVVDRDKSARRRSAAGGERGHDAPGRVDPLGLTTLDQARLQTTIGRAAGEITSAVGQWLTGPGVESGGRGDFILEVLYGMKAETESALGEHRRSQISSLTDSLTALARATARVEGRKFLVLFSQGFDARFLYDEGGAQTLGDLQEIVDAYRETGWSVQSIDPTGIGQMEEEGTDALLVVARETGGELYQSFNRLDEAMAQMLDRTSVTYLLTFRADDVPLDGAFHPIRVRLRDVPGARAVHRAGYYAKPLSETADLTRLEVAQLLLGDEEHEQIGTAVMAYPFPAAAGQTAVSVVLRLAGSDLVGDGKDELGAEVYGYALGPDQRVHDFFGQTLGFKRRKELADGDLKVFASLRLAPGRYKLRLLVRRPWDGRYTASSFDLEVPDLATAGPVLATPLFAETTSGPVAFIEREAGSEDEYPFKIGDRTFVPAVAPVLDSASRSSFLVTGYGVDLGRHQLGAQLVNGAGESLGGERFAFERSEKAEGANASRLYFTLDPTGLAADDYRLYVRVVDPESEAGSTVSARFRVE